MKQWPSKTAPPPQQTLQLSSAEQVAQCSFSEAQWLPPFHLSSPGKPSVPSELPPFLIALSLTYSALPSFNLALTEGMNDSSLDSDLGWAFPSPCLSPDAFILQYTDRKARRPFLGVFLEVEAELLDFIKLPQTVCWGWDWVGFLPLEEMPQGYDLSSVSRPKQTSNSSTSLSHHSMPHIFLEGEGLG